MRLLIGLLFAVGLYAQGVPSPGPGVFASSGGGTCAAPTFSPTGGYATSFTLSAACTVICYSTSSITVLVAGTCPVGSTTYTTSVSISPPVVYFAVATQLLMTASSNASASYNAGPSFLQFSGALSTSGASAVGSQQSNAFSATNTNGNYILVYVGLNASFISLSAIDLAGNSYSCGDDSNSTTEGGMCVAKVTAGGFSSNKVTVSAATGTHTFFSVVAVEVQNTSGVDVSFVGGAGNGTSCTTAVTTVNAGDLVTSICNVNGGPSLTPQSGFTATSPWASAVYLTGGLASHAYTPGVTWTGSQNWGSVGMAMKP